MWRRVTQVPLQCPQCPAQWRQSVWMIHFVHEHWLQRALPVLGLFTCWALSFVCHSTDPGGAQAVSPAHVTSPCTDRACSKIALHPAPTHSHPCSVPGLSPLSLFPCRGAVVRCVSSARPAPKPLTNTDWVGFRERTNTARGAVAYGRHSDRRPGKRGLPKTWGELFDSKRVLQWRERCVSSSTALRGNLPHRLWLCCCFFTPP